MTDEKVIDDMTTYDVIIVGAGAAGLMCAISAGQRGKSVLLLDKASKAAEKIRISGGGRCNFTNVNTSANHFISNNPHFCKSALAGFTPYDFIDWVNDADIAYHEREHGQLFCDQSAQQIIAMLLQKCADYQVEIRLNSDIHNIQKDHFFTVQSSTGAAQSPSLVIATGALSIPKMGATGFGLAIAQQFALDVVPTRAGLVPFTFTGKEKAQLQALAGIALPVRVQVQGKKRQKISFSEAMLFTHRGLSGPAMLQISSYWLPGDTLEIDLLPQLNIATIIAEQIQVRPLAQLSTVLASLLPKRL
ncbi:MAG: aminoacetone oxidase family FAD-binding enzyme, partial [Mariprofundaceae bacterium]|nr:aminoacetone oxidase family FAD-binding enzyme [Mariprofundaceae bacterium]